MEEDRDRRRFVRFPAEFAVLVRRLGPGETENLGKTEVVGQGGCLFIHPQPLGLEETVELLISTRGSVLKAKARVAYESRREDGRYDIGVEFLAMSAEDQEKLRQALQASELTPRD
ncbi:MAG: PilZ domain-containing protein [Acidobacteriota bacterium]